LNVGDLRERSYRDFHYRAEKLAAAFEGRIASEVTGEEIKAWLNGLEIGSRSNKNYLSVVGEVFKFTEQTPLISTPAVVTDLKDVTYRMDCLGG
jgi:hypothetical protein